eukprot:CAMPEP_0113322312 /NCGR_PEP_ID=MMETSP0010_2-20120614/15525_1 /TAXON_ID=216773 ORGANISM="Corethron hystrix, Strain 308" /NCGR_SAMPLE_ID=MMETSP0010_2 /ASSEMBLY_ACC=CAM_ASM_000155 /LENGTH=151 /DNA_ID=CAMNT_0000180777 /DNA_START=109 /DNA_END=561 /DNA_ORIENTATION=+ /assembly_acc=CAM_ASM_000155
MAPRNTQEFQNEFPEDDGPISPTDGNGIENRDKHFDSDIDGDCQEGRWFCGHTNRSSMKFFEAANKILVEYHKSSYDINKKVVELRSPQQIETEFFDAGVPLSLTDGNNVDEAKILTAMEKTLELGVRMNHPLFLNQLTAGINSVGLAGEW